MFYIVTGGAWDRDQPAIAVPLDKAARICGIGKTKLYQFIASGELRSVKIGTRRVVLVETLSEWMRRKESDGITDLRPVVVPRDRDKHTLGSMSPDMARRAREAERLLASDLAEGDVGAEILRRAASIRPIPMPVPGSRADEYMKSRLRRLQERFDEDMF